MLSAQVSILALLLTSRVTLDKSLYPSVLEFALCRGISAVARVKQYAVL